MSVCGWSFPHGRHSMPWPAIECEGVAPAGHDLARADEPLAEVVCLVDVLAAAIVYLATPTDRPLQLAERRHQLAQAVETAAPDMIAETRQEITR